MYPQEKMYPKQKMNPDWIQNGITDEAVEWSKSFGQYLTTDDSLNPLSTSQIRKFFGELKRIQADPEKYKEEIPMLKAKLAYAVGRDKKIRGKYSKIKKLYEELELGINSIRKDKNTDLIRFVKLVESIVAFHKFFGGK